MCKKVSVVFRQLHDHSPVVTEIKVVPDDITYPVVFAESHCNEVKQKFCAKFVEFKVADWYSVLFDLIE